jgi:hypothetical protein
MVTKKEMIFFYKLIHYSSMLLVENIFMINTLPLFHGQMPFKNRS